MKQYTFATTETVNMDNIVSLNGHFFKVTDDVADLVYKVINDALTAETAKRSTGAAPKVEVKSTATAKSSTKTSKSSTKTSSKSDATLNSDEVTAESKVITCVATMTPFGKKGIIVEGVKSGTWKVIRERLSKKFGEDVEYVRQNGDVKGHFEFRSKVLRDKALADDNLPIVIWNKDDFKKR